MPQIWILLQRSAKLWNIFAHIYNNTAEKTDAVSIVCVTCRYELVHFLWLDKCLFTVTLDLYCCHQFISSNGWRVESTFRFTVTSTPWAQYREGFTSLRHNPFIRVGHTYIDTDGHMKKKVVGNKVVGKRLFLSSCSSTWVKISLTKSHNFEKFGHHHAIYKAAQSDDRFLLTLYNSIQ